MRRAAPIGWIVILAMLLVSPATANHDEDDHSDNIHELANEPIVVDEGMLADGSDLAFKGNLVIAGSYDGAAFFRISKRAPYLEQVGMHICPGGQGDISVYGHFAFVSLDGPTTLETNVCNNTDSSVGKEGLRVVDFSNLRQPRQVKFIETDCGSHTHTIYPTGRFIYIYIQSYPLGAQTASCSVATHRKVSIVRMPKGDPSKAEVVSTLDVTPEIGCHDVTIYPKLELAAAACIAESQIWDMSDPAHPVILSRIVNPAIEIHHGTAMTWDGKVMAIADEFAGSITGTCVGEQQSPIGALWFYDISDPELPQPLGYYNVPRRALPESQGEATYLACTTHNFNILPTKDGSYVAAVGYRNAGVSIVDFSNPAGAEEIAHYLDLTGGEIPDVWSAYWYNGRIYANDNGAQRGVSVYELDGYGTKQVKSFRDGLNPQLQLANFSR